MNNFGGRSKAVLSTLHKDLQKILLLALSRSNVDFGLHEGARTIETQQQYYNEGKSRINPSEYPSPEALAEKAKHIVVNGSGMYELSRAVDLHAAEKYEGKSLAWDDTHLSYIAGVIVSCGKELYTKGEISHLVRWGGDWDNDGVIALDHRLKDLPHFELVKPA